MNNDRQPSDDSWPVDSDVASDDIAVARTPGSAFDPRRVAVVFIGGLAGGFARYEAVTRWAAASGAFPWSTFVVNTTGALVLAVIVIVVTRVIGPSKYVRLLLGTGFCGALTTFSSVAAQTDELAAHSHLGLAIAYCGGSLVAGLATIAVGVALGRRLPPTANRLAMPAGGT